MIEIELPLRLVSVANVRECWQQKAARTKAHRRAAIAVPKHAVPCVVTITRIGPRMLDGDNLQSACKGLRDGIADRLGVDDRDPAVEWRYTQEIAKPKRYAVRVRIESEAA
ncbi:hypothetical protein [Dyella japonica]|uniref:Uncharacterized protein n=1 Tax=Dyella japonica TaxID=231455 RepID=A0ABV2JZ08_9GAMM